MPKVTFEITPEQRKLMDSFPKVNWSEILRKTIEREAARQELVQRIEEELDSKDVAEIAELVNEEIRKRWRREFGKPGRR